MESSSGVERWKILAERIAKELKERSGYEFKLEMLTEPSLRWICNREKPKYPVKSPDGRELGLMFINAELKHVYLDAERKIKWPDDWIDPYPPFIDSVWLDCESIAVRSRGKMDLEFMALAYYCLNVDFYWEDMEREDLQKISRFMPMVVKDISKSMRLAEEACSKYGIDKSELRISFNLLRTDNSEIRISLFNRLSYELSFKMGNMNDDEIVENVLRRSEALTEFERKFNEWLASEERRIGYESTMVYPDDPFRWRCNIPSVISEPEFPFMKHFSWRKYEGMRILCKWPFKSENVELNKRYERKLKRELRDWASALHYNLDGYRLRLAKKTKSGLRYLGKVNRKGWITINKNRLREEDLDREDIVIAIDKRLKRLPKFPLKKIEFLKEDFPEMFK